MVNEQYERAKKILSENQEGHNRLAQLLIDKEVIFAEDVEHIFGKRPWASRSEEISANKTAAELKKRSKKKSKSHRSRKGSQGRRRKHENNFIQRAVTGVLFVIVLVGCIIYSPLSFGILFTIISALSVHEFAQLVSKSGEVSINKTITALGEPTFSLH